MGKKKCVECGGDPFYLDDLGVEPNVCVRCGGFLCPTHDAHTKCEPAVREPAEGDDSEIIARLRARVAELEKDLVDLDTAYKKKLADTEKGVRAGRSELTLETAHRSPDYQFFLGLFADAVGATGAPTLYDVLQKAKSREYRYKDESCHE